MRLRLLLDRKRQATTIGIILMAVLTFGLLAAGPIMASSGASVSSVPPTPAIPCRTECYDSSGSAAQGTETGHEVQSTGAHDQAPHDALDLKAIVVAGPTPESGDHDMAGHADASSAPAAHDMTDHSEATQEPAAHDMAGHADAAHDPAAHEGAGHGDAPEQEATAHGHGAEAQPIPAATRSLVLGSFGAANGLVIAVAAVLKRKAIVTTRLRRDSVAGTLPAGDAQ